MLTTRKWKAGEQVLQKNIDSTTFFDLIEELLVAGTTSLSQTLRLVSMYSLVNNGIKPKLYDQLRANIIYTHGIQHLITLDNLNKMGLLTVSTGQKSEYTKLQKAFKLINPYESLVEPKLPSYAYGGYCPLSIRLVQIATTSFQPQNAENSESIEVDSSKDVPKFKPHQEILKLIPGTWFEKSVIPDHAQDPSRKKRTLVVFVGGCTAGEVSALRVLSKQGLKC